MANFAAGLEVLTYVIASSPDLTIRIFHKRHGWDGDKIIAHDYHVSRTSMIRQHYFRAMLTGRFAEANRDLVTLEGDSPSAMQLLFQMLHGSVDHMSYKWLYPCVWHLLEAAEKYGIELRTVGGPAWFAKWYDHQNLSKLRIEERRILLYPCYAFDYAKAFAEETKFLAYNARRNIRENRILEVPNDRLQLPQGVMRMSRMPRLKRKKLDC